MTVTTNRSMRFLSTTGCGGVNCVSPFGVGFGDAAPLSTKVECPQSWHRTNAPGGDTDCPITWVREPPHRLHLRSSCIEEIAAGDRRVLAFQDPRHCRARD